MRIEERSLLRRAPRPAPLYPVQRRIPGKPHNAFLREENHLLRRVTLWLWSGRIGVFSHETALALYQLSDVLPSKVHLTVPSAWKARRIHVPTGLALHFSDLADDNSTWAGAVRVTSARRTVIDCATAQVSPDLLRQAINEGLHQGLFTIETVKAAAEYLRVL